MIHTKRLIGMVYQSQLEEALREIEHDSFEIVSVLALPGMINTYIVVYRER